MTALQFVMTFRQVRVLSLGAEDVIYWMLIEADVDGTEPQHYLVMEMLGQARYVQNPPLNALDHVRRHFQCSERCE